jgi:hypothetical protein
VSIPDPQPGLVIRYSYLWLSEYLAGREEGNKDRPAAIIAAILVELDGEYRALVLPITHAAPSNPEDAVEIPIAIKRRLGFDDAQSWIILSEANEFVWPGPDLRRVPGDSGVSFSYGFLPPRYFGRVRDAFIARLRQKQARRIPRSE